MVRLIPGRTKKGDEYHIVGGKSYIKEDGCYRISLVELMEFIRSGVFLQKT